MIKLFEMEIEQTQDILIEGTGKGDLLLSITGEGTFSGKRLSGKVLPVGAVTTYTPSGGINIIQAPLLLETDDGAKVFMQIDAYLHLAQELEEKILAEEFVSPKEYYYKGTVKFLVGGSKYKWLETRVFTCEGVIDSWQLLKFAVYEV